MPDLLFRAHAVQRMFERQVSAKRVRAAVELQDVIEDYSHEMSAPSRLLMGMQGRRPFHVVVTEDPCAVTVVTVYLPSLDKWKKDFRSRKG